MGAGRWGRERLITGIISLTFVLLLDNNAILTVGVQQTRGLSKILCTPYTLPSLLCHLSLTFPVLLCHLVPRSLHAHQSTTSQLLRWRWHLCSPSLKFTVFHSLRYKTTRERVPQSLPTGILLRVHLASGAQPRVSHECPFQSSRCRLGHPVPVRLNL